MTKGRYLVRLALNYGNSVIKVGLYQYKIIYILLNLIANALNFLPGDYDRKVEIQWI